MQAASGSGFHAGGSAASSLRVQDVGDLVLPVWVASDVHLAEGDEALFQRFMAFLRARAREGGSLLLIGDLFEVWAGSFERKRAMSRRLLEALAWAAGEGLFLAFLPGNRDFLFRGSEGVVAWPDVVLARCGPRRILFSHGDLLCTGDLGYLRLRRLLRTPLVRVAARMFPAFLVSPAARLLRRWGRGRPRRSVGPARPASLIDYGEARRWLERVQADALVIGHAHMGVSHVLEDDGRREIHVLRDWQQGGSVVRIDAGGLSHLGVEEDASAADLLLGDPSPAKGPASAGGIASQS